MLHILQSFDHHQQALLKYPCFISNKTVCGINLVSCFFSPQLHYTNNSDQATHTSSSTTLQHKVIPTLLPLKGKENNNPQATDKQDEGINNNKQENNTSVYHINQFPTTQTILLREWII